MVLLRWSSRAGRTFFFPAPPAIFASLGAGAVGLFVIGASISVFTGRSAIFSGTRQLALGLMAAGATFAIGKLVGVAVAG
jgi:VIT1/CCC1 family predicted Fe2+/Mn2+ transporter